MRTHELLKGTIPEVQSRRVFSQECVEIDHEFLGFTEVYKALAALTPCHYTVIDLGCYCAAQAFYFESHKEYIGVDIYEGERFVTKNTKHFVTSIQQFCKAELHRYCLSTTMAICSYVPDEDAKKSVRESFNNLFVYYPAGIENPILLRK